MLTYNTHPQTAGTSRVISWAIHMIAMSALVYMLFPGDALAASSWSPSLLVNTEAFQIIDRSDTAATSVEIRFGDSLGQRLYYDTTNLRFQFTRSLAVAGDITATGSVLAKGTLSGQTLIVSGVSSHSGAAMFKTNATVKGILSGSVLRISTNADIHGALTASGAFRTDSNITINDDADSNDAVLTFGNTSGNQTLKYINANQRFDFSANLNVLGSISGRTLVISGASSFSGSSLFRTNLGVKGTLSGSSFIGAGLGDCSNITTQKLVYNPATGKFVCATDQTSGGGGGISYTDAEGMFVNQRGDTMSGMLTIDLKNTNTGTGLFLVEKAYFGSGATLSGSFVHQTIGTPNNAPLGNLKTYAVDNAGRALLSARGYSGAEMAYQPAFFTNQIMTLNAGGGTTINGYGTTVTNDTTISHVADQTFGYMANFATTAVSADTAGTSSANTTFFRGSTTGANGFFFSTRVGVVDTTSIRVYAGLADQTIATMVGNDNPAGNYVGFQFSTNRADTNWQFITKNGTTQNVVTTSVAFTANKVYDLSFYCLKQCTVMGWQIKNITDGTLTKGTTSTNLPTTSTALRMVLGVSTLTTAAKNFRMQQAYCESDR